MPGLIYKLDQETAEQYFERYFNRNYLNNALRINIGYPVFYWGNNHNVDGTYVGSTEALKKFKQRLLKKAGADRNNYLRSMFGDGFFKKNPQEFVASLANQYFCSSRDMFLYALKKAKEGNLNQINQFVLMASIYADGDKTCFYGVNKRGDVRVVAVSVEKKDGLVSAILVNGKRYSFDYKDGIIEKISSQQRPQSQ